MKEGTEIVGVLSLVENEEDNHKLIFTMIKKIEIPRRAISAKKLLERQGQTIGILKIDGRFRVRIIPNDKEMPW